MENGGLKMESDAQQRSSILHPSIFHPRLDLPWPPGAVADGIVASRPRADVLDGAGTRAGEQRHARAANEDIDSTRFKLEFVPQMIEDLRWFGFEWQEGPDCGGAFGPYSQSERRPFYAAALEKLRERGFVYPCTCSHKDIRDAASAPNAGDDEGPIYPGTCRSNRQSENRKPLHQPFPEILRATWHFLDFPGGEPGKQYHAHRHNPRHQHGIGDKTAFMTEGLGALRNALLRGSGLRRPDAANAAGLAVAGAASPGAAFRAASGAQIKKALAIISLSGCIEPQ